MLDTSEYQNGRPAGLIKGHPAKRATKVCWTTENDRKLLIFGLGKEISKKEYQVIANTFPEKPTAKAIQERLVKLRAEQRALLQHVGIIDHNLATVSSPERTQCDSNNPRNISSPPVTQATEYQSQAMKRPCSPDDIKETDVSDKVSTSFDDRKFQTQVRLCSPNTVAPEKLLLVGRQGNHPAEHQIWSNVSSTKRQRLENTPVALNEEDLGSKCACGNTSRKHEAI